MEIKTKQVEEFVLNRQEIDAYATLFALLSEKEIIRLFVSGGFKKETAQNFYESLVGVYNTTLRHDEAKE